MQTNSPRIVISSAWEDASLGPYPCPKSRTKSRKQALRPWGPKSLKVENVSNMVRKVSKKLFRPCGDFSDPLQDVSRLLGPQLSCRKRGARKRGCNSLMFVFVHICLSLLAFVTFVCVLGPIAESLKSAFGGALNPYILNQDIAKWHSSAHGAV